MWARVVEVMIAIWLALSPFIFHYLAEEKFLWMNDFICACFVALFALFSFWHRLRKIHLVTIALAFWLLGLGYGGFPEKASAAAQNSVVIGLLLLMLAIVPSYLEQPSFSWKKFIIKRRKHG